MFSFSGKLSDIYLQDQASEVKGVRDVAVGASGALYWITQGEEKTGHVWKGGKGTDGKAVAPEKLTKEPLELGHIVADDSSVYFTSGKTKVFKYTTEVTEIISDLKNAGHLTLV
jgi:hypothetical protein